MNEVLQLTEDLFVAKGTQKAVYVYPGDIMKCVKVKIIDKNDDMNKELKYRKVLKRRGKQLSMLPEYYGEVTTNFGKGYVFEYIRDFDGNVSKSLYEYLHTPDMALSLLQIDIYQVLRKFKDEYIKEMVVTSDVDPRNFLVQRLSSNNFKIVIVDNLGTPNVLQLAYWFDCIAKHRAKKYWRRFIKDIMKDYPQLNLKNHDVNYNIQ